MATGFPGDLASIHVFIEESGRFFNVIPFAKDDEE
jgi:hypothetical protein